MIKASNNPFSSTPAIVAGTSFKGTFLTLAELQTKFPTPEAGSYANIVNPNIANDDLAVWNTTTATWNVYVGDGVGPNIDISGKQNLSEKGAANGYPSLGSDAKIPDAQIPANLTALPTKVTALEQNQVDGFERYDTLALLNAIPTKSVTKRYVVDSDGTATNNGTYKWNGSAFVKVAEVDTAKIKTWVAQIYQTGDQVNYLGNDWVANTSTISTDVPSISSKWTERLTGYAKHPVALPSNNNFIKELYITGWTSGDLYMRWFTNTDGGNKVTFEFQDQNQVLKIFTYQLANNLNIYPLNTSGGASGSGFGGYLVVDWSKYTTFIHTANQNTLKVSESAKQLSNSPYISEYLNKITADSSISSLTTKLDLDFMSDKTKNGTNLFSVWDTTLKSKLERFIVRLRVVDESGQLTSVSLIDRGGSAGARFINMKNQSGAWVTYNSALVNKNTQIGIQRYVYQFGIYLIDITINWDALPSETSFSSLVVINWDKTDTIYDERKEIDNISKSLIYNNVFKYNLAVDNITTLLSGNVGFTITQETNGLRLRASGITGRYEVKFTPPSSKQLDYMYNHYYAVILDYTLTNDSTHSFDAFSIQGEKYGPLFDTTWGIRKGVSNNQMGQRLIEARIIKAPSSPTEVHQTRLGFYKYNNNATVSEVLDVTIHNLMIVDLGLGNDNRYLGKTIYDFSELIRKTGHFEKLVITENAQVSVQRNSLYQNLKLKSLGDSLPETTSFQPWIAHALGMSYDGTEEKAGSGGYKPSVKGATRLVPTITTYTGETASAGWSIYSRAKDLKQYKPDVLLILAGYNDPSAGQPYISGGTSLQPADYGLNDLAYTGGEIDLVANSTLSVPSFGACYRGMLQQIFTDMPHLRVVLIAPPRGSGGVNITSSEYLAILGKTAVIRQVAKEFGCPFVSLSDVYGVNAFNYTYLTQDNLHFGYFGGRRVAMEIMGACF